MSRALRLGVPILGAVAWMLLVPATAAAHPLGNFTINTSAGIVVDPGAVRVEYVVDMAEIPTVQAMPRLDPDGDGLVTASERSDWSVDRAEELLGGLILSVDDRPVSLSVIAAAASLLPGQGGLDVLRLEATFAGSLEAARGVLAFRDANFEGRVGWHEVTAASTEGVAIARSDVPASSVTDRLRTYPDDLLSDPLDVREATLSFEPGWGAPSATIADESSRPGGSVTALGGGALADLAGRTGPWMIAGFALAFGFGALHAIGPGHGKTLMAAYLVAGDGRTRHAVAVGGAVAVMHTASVLALGLVVLSATEVFAPERVYPWLGLVSGLIALGLGAGLLVTRLGAWGEGRRPPVHHHGRPPGHEHAGGHGHGHHHPVPAPGSPVLTRRGLTALAVAGGILPSPTALVVLLGSVALHRVSYGLALIGAFSLGLAAALVAVGILALRARDVLARRLSGRLTRLMPLASATAIAMLGLALTVNGILQF